MGFLWISLAALAVGGQFSLSKVYKNKLPSSNYGDLFYNFAMGLFSAMLFAVVCLGKVGFTAFSFWLAAGVALCSTLYTLCGLKAVTYGKLAVFTAFLMLGGMIFPTVYGVLFLKEQMSAFKIAGVVLLIASMIFSATEKTEEKKNTAVFYILCLIAFVSNGFVYIFQSAPDRRGRLEYVSIFFLAIGDHRRRRRRPSRGERSLQPKKRRIFSAYPKERKCQKFGIDRAYDRHHARGKRAFAARRQNGARVVSVSRYDGHFHIRRGDHGQAVFQGKDLENQFRLHPRGYRRRRPHGILRRIYAKVVLDRIDRF